MNIKAGLPPILSALLLSALLARAQTGGSAANQAAAGMAAAGAADVTGTLEVVEICYVDHAEQTFSVTAEQTGVKHPLDFAVKPAAGHLTGERVRVRGNFQGAEIRVPASADPAVAGLEVLAAAPTSKQRTTTVQPKLLYAGGTNANTLVHKTRVHLLIYSDYATNTYTATDITNFSNEFFATNGISVNTEYLQDSYGAVGFAGDVVICHIAAPSGTCDTGTWQSQANASAVAQGYTNAYDNYVYICSGACGWAGVAVVGGNWSFDFYTDGGTICHELGHNLGFAHASTQWNNTSGWVEYGDGSDFMGANYEWQHNNAPHKAQLGWVAAQTVTNAGTYQISRIEDVPATVPHPQLLTVPSSSSYPGASVNGWPYYFSYKQVVGYDTTVGGYDVGLSIHRWGGGGSHTATIAVLSDGGSFTDSQIGLTVKQISHDTNSVTVVIAFCTGAAPPYTIVMTSAQLAAHTTMLADVCANSACNPMVITNFDAVSAQGGAVTLTNNQLFYTPPGVFSGNDTFNYTVTNMLGVASSATVTILQVTQPPYNWDANGATAGTGGTGTWDTSSFTWDNGVNVWPGSGVANTAAFGGTAGTVSLAAGGVAANGLDFKTNGYVLQNSTLTLNGTAPFVVLEAGVNAGLSAALAGTQGFNFYGSGTLTLSGTNALSGTIQVNAGNLQLGNAGSAGNLGSTTVTNNGTVSFNRGDSTAVSNVISGAGAIAQVGTGTTTLTATNTFTGPTIISAGTLTVGGAGQLGGGSYAGSIPNNAAFVYNSSAVQTLSGGISGSGTLTQNGPGMLTLTGTNTYLGNTYVNAGQLILANPFAYASAVNTINAGGVMVITNAVAGNLSPNTTYTGAGIFRKTGAGLVGNNNAAVYFYMSTNGVIDWTAGDFNFGGGQSEMLLNYGGLNVAAGATFHISDPAWQADGLTGGGKVNNAYNSTTPVLTLGVAGTANNSTYGVTNSTATFAGVIGYSETYNTVSVASMILVKVGAGTQILTGTNGYTGPTTISSGTLMIGGSGCLGGGNYPGAIADSGAFIYNSSAAQTFSGLISGSGNFTQAGPGKLTLSAASTFSGPFTINDGAALGVAISGATQLSPATFTEGSSAGPTTNEFAGLVSTTAAPVTTSNLIVKGTSTMNILSGAFAAGQIYPLISFTTLSGAGNFVLGTLPAGVAASVVTNNSSIALSVTATPGFVWVGNVNGTWDINTTANWKTNGVAAKYIDNNQAALFDDTASRFKVTNTVAVSPGGIIVNNTTNAYTISGSAIGGSGGVIKNGTNTLTLASTANSYTGPTTVQGGTMILSNFPVAANGGNPVAGASVVVASGATLTVNYANGVTKALSSLTGGGTFNLVGTGTYNPIYCGGTAQTMAMSSGANFHVVSGTVQLGYGYAAHWINNQAGLIVDGAATFNLWDNVNDGNGIRFDALNGAGIITETEGQANTLYLGVANGSGTFAGTITDTGGANTLTLAKTGSGTQTFTGTNSYTGTTTISNGMLTIGGAGLLGGGNYAGAVANTAALTYNSTAAQILSGVISGGGTLTQAGPGTLILTGANTYTGNTYVAGGRLLLANPGSYVSASNFISAGAVLVVTNAASLALQSPTMYAGAGVFQKVGTGTVGNNNAAVHFYLSTNGVIDWMAGDCNLGGNQAEMLNNYGGLNVAAGATFHISDNAWQVDGLTGSGKINNAYNNTSPVLTLGVAGTANNSTYGVTNNTATFAGVIGYSETYNTVSVASMSLIKTGAGTQILTGTNGYTGTTTVAAGKLVVSSAQTGTGAITLNDGAALGVTVSGTGQLSPATLTEGSASGPTTNEFAGVSSTAVAPIRAGTLALKGTTTINLISGALAAGQAYPLISYTTINGMGGFKLGTLPAGISATVVTNNSSIALNVTAAPTTVWNGNVNGTWDIAGITNWTFNGSPATYLDGSVVQFNDTAAGATVVSNAVTVSPGGLLVNNTNKPYTFALGGSPIAGGGGLTKSGPGTLTVSNVNTFTGGAALNGGTLQACAPETPGTSGPLGRLGGIAFGGGTLQFSALDTADYSPRFSTAASQACGIDTAGQNVTFGTALTSSGGSLTKLGGGTLTLASTANSYTGPTTVQGGTLILSNFPVAGNGGNPVAGASVSIASGATLTVNYASGVTKALSALTGGGTFNLVGIGTYDPIYCGGTVQVLAMSSGGLWHVVSGNCRLGYGYAANWSNNLGGLTIDSGASMDLWDTTTSGIRFDALNGAGTLTDNNGSGNTLWLGVAGGSGTFTGVILQGSHGITLIKTGTGTQVLAGTNTYTGTTTISNGTLLVSGSLAAGSAVTVQTNGTLGGTGTVAGAVTVNGVMVPGPGLGTLNTGAETWNGGGSYVCNLGSTNAGGGDLLNITGALTVAATSGSPFTVKLVSLGAGNVPGAVTNFYKFTNCAWTVATASGGVANFATNKVVLDASAFVNDFSGGTFGLAVAGNSLVLNYKAAPLVWPRFTGTASAGTAGMQLTATGGVGQAYVLFGTTNLAPANWLPLATNTAGTNGAVQFADPQATNYPQRFYRITSP
jgi:autotransporter-associated beta strand protein